MLRTVGRSSAAATSAPVAADDCWSRPTGRGPGGVPVPLLLCLGAAIALAAIDAPLARAQLQGRWAQGLVAFLDRVETFGHGVGIGVVLIAAFLLDTERRRCMVRLIACPVAAGLAANCVKLTVGRRRPWAWLTQQGETVPSQFVEWFPLGTNPGSEQSFPSSHTAAAFGLALGLGALYPRGRAFFLTMAAFVAMQRSVFYSHYVSDVLVGAAVAWLAVVGLFRYGPVDRLFWRLERPRSPDAQPVEMSRAA